MEERNYCPKCGHRFVQGESNYNYETGMLDFTCPDCEWEGTHHDVLNVDNVLGELEDEKDDYELDGVELTDEDAEQVISKVIEYGEEYEDAKKQVMSGIRETLDEGLEDEDEDVDLSDKLEHYNGSYNKRILKKEGLCIVTWPESQYVTERPKFWEHAWLINDPYGLNRFGSSAYVVEEDWYCE